MPVVPHDGKVEQLRNDVIESLERVGAALLANRGEASEDATIACGSDRGKEFVVLREEVGQNQEVSHGSGFRKTPLTIEAKELRRGDLEAPLAFALQLFDDLAPRQGDAHQFSSGCYRQYRTMQYAPKRLTVTFRSAMDPRGRVPHPRILSRLKRRSEGVLPGVPATEDQYGERRPAIFVFRSEQFTKDDDGKEPEAVYWLEP